MELHERVRYLRKDVLKQSQAEFAEKLGTSRDAINNIEGNRLKRPEQKEPLLKLMCEKFNINEDWLLTGEGEMRRPVSRDAEIAAFMDQIMKSESEDFRRRLVVALSKLDTAEWEMLERLAVNLAEEQHLEHLPKAKRDEPFLPAYVDRPGGELLLSQTIVLSETEDRKDELK